MGIDRHDEWGYRCGRVIGDAACLAEQQAKMGGGKLPFHKQVKSDRLCFAQLVFLNLASIQPQQGKSKSLETCKT